jgi:hypothetical protein
MEYVFALTEKDGGVEVRSFFLNGIKLKKEDDSEDWRVELTYKDDSVVPLALPVGCKLKVFDSHGNTVIDFEVPGEVIPLSWFSYPVYPYSPNPYPLPGPSFGPMYTGVGGSEKITETVGDVSIKNEYSYFATGAYSA